MDVWDFSSDVRVKMKQPRGTLRKCSIRYDLEVAFGGGGSLYHCSGVGGGIEIRRDLELDAL